MTVIDSRIGLLPPDVNKVLETMFTSYSQVIVKSEFSGGFGGSRVFLVRSIRQDGKPELPSVVKVDEFDRIAQEWQAYQNCIQNRLPNVAKISGEPVYPPGNQQGGVRYPLAGDGAFNVVSLQDYYHQASIDEIEYVLKERLFKSLEKLWEQKGFQAELNLHTAYDSFLYPNLMIEYVTIPIGTISRQLRPDNVRTQTHSYQVEEKILLSGFEVVRILRKSQTIILDIPSELPGAYRLQVHSVPDLDTYEVGQIIHQPLTGRVKKTREGALQEQAAKVLGSGVDLTAVSLSVANYDPLPNPLVALPKLLNLSFDAYITCIHADLHLGNVLVEPKSGNIHLIDFVNAREDHVLRDFLHLELAIVTRLIPVELDRAELSPKRIISFYERLHCALRYPGQISAPTGLEKPFAMLNIIRETAEHHLFKKGEWQEYYYCLIFYLLGSLRYGDLDGIPGAKQTAFWAAATVLKLADAEVSCNEFVIDHINETHSSSLTSGKGKEEEQATATHADNRTGGVYFGSGKVNVGGDVVGGNQTKTQFHGPVSGPIHTGSGNINVTDRQERQVNRPGFEHLRLDTAVPSEVYRAQLFDVAVAVRQPTSPILTVDELNQVKSGSLQPSWPPDASAIQLRVEINAPDCDIQGADSYTFQLHHGQNSPVYYFKLVPRSVGKISLIFTVYQETLWIGSARAEALVRNEIVGSVQTRVSSYAIKQRQVLRQILDKHFNESELHNLTFELGVDYEALSGFTKQDKARELITYLERRDRVPELIQACQQLRPTAPWWSSLDKIWETPAS